MILDRVSPRYRGMDRYHNGMNHHVTGNDQRAIDRIDRIDRTYRLMDRIDHHRDKTLSWLTFIVTVSRPDLSTIVPVDLSDRLTSFIPELLKRK